MKEFLYNSYLSYLTEDIDEAYEEMDRYLEAKEGVFKDNFYLRDHLQIPYIRNVLSKQKTQDAIIDLVSNFLDNHVDQLTTSGPVFTFSFADNETKVLYNLFGITKEDIIKIFNETVNETYFGKIALDFVGWVKQAPHKLLLNAILIESLQKGYENMIECVKWMYSFTEYPIVYREFWPIGVKKDVMDYTVDHLGSKFKITHMKNIQELIFYHSNKVITSKDEKLKVGLDDIWITIIQLIRNQFMNNFRNIANAYYENDKLGVTKHEKNSQFDDGTLADQEGHTTNVARAVDNTINKFATTSINTATIRHVADNTNVNKDILTSFINKIIKDKNNNLYKFIEDIITSYFNRNPTNTSVGSTEFLNFGLSVYRSIGTSKNEIYIDIKNILGYWMNTIIGIDKLYSSAGTRICYTRAIFNYMIFTIYSYN